MSECVLKALACRGLRVGPSKVWKVWGLGCGHWVLENRHRANGRGEGQALGWPDCRESITQIRANRLRVPKLNPLFFYESRFQALKLANRRFEEIRVNRSKGSEYTIIFFCESIRANRLFALRIAGPSKVKQFLTRF